MVSVGFLSSSVLLCFGLFLRLLLLLRCLCVVGRMGNVLSVVSFPLWASVHLLMTIRGEEGMIFFFQLVGCASCNSTAFRNGFFYFFFKLTLDCFSLCFSWLLLWRAARICGPPQHLAVLGVSEKNQGGSFTWWLMEPFQLYLPLLVTLILLVVFSAFCCS